MHTMIPLLDSATDTVTKYKFTICMNQRLIYQHAFKVKSLSIFNKSYQYFKIVQMQGLCKVLLWYAGKKELETN